MYLFKKYLFEKSTVRLKFYLYLLFWFIFLQKFELKGNIFALGLEKTFEIEKCSN